MAKRFKKDSQEWELSGWNDLGVPYFVKVRRGKAQKKQFTLTGFGLGSVKRFGVKATNIFTNPFTGKKSKRWKTTDKRVR